MATFTSTLPDALWKRLDVAAKGLKQPKNKLIERALEIYLDQLNRAEYIKSFNRAAQDAGLMSIAEEGMVEYLTQLQESDATR
jgi:predicted transcriptional regulator